MEYILTIIILSAFAIIFFSIVDYLGKLSSLAEYKDLGYNFENKLEINSCTIAIDEKKKKLLIIKGFATTSIIEDRELLLNFADIAYCDITNNSNENPTLIIRLADENAPIITIPIITTKKKLEKLQAWINLILSQEKEKYIDNEIEYYVPTKKDIEHCKDGLKNNFNEPENVFNNWLHYALTYGPKLVAPTIDYFKTLSHQFMPDNYIEDVIEEFLERLDLKLFNYKNSRFKFMRTNDRVSREFSKRINASSKVTIENIDAMTGIEFEHFLCKLFAEDGFNAKVTQASNDQGGDLILEKGGGRIVVQVKRYSTHVPNSAIQEVVAAKALYNCEYGMVITNNYFTKSAIKLAQHNDVTLWNRDTLQQKLSQYNASILKSPRE